MSLILTHGSQKSFLDVMISFIVVVLFSKKKKEKQITLLLSSVLFYKVLHSLIHQNSGL